MSSISEFMLEHHRLCDDHFAAVEEAVAKKDWKTAAESWEKFSVELDKHLSNFEEGILFPAFEEVGGPMGPIMVMRQEHQQMRAVVEQMDAALKAENDGDFLGLSETFMVLTQQHNMKEEQILYPMMDSNLPGAEALLEELKSQ